MVTKRDMRHILQERADLQREVRELKAEGREITKKPRDDWDQDRLDEIDALLDSHDEKLIQLTEEEARQRRYIDEELSSRSLGEGHDAPTPQAESTFPTFGSMLQAVRHAAVNNYRDRDVDPRLSYGAAVSGGNEGTGAEGGFLVGEDTSNELVRNLHNTGVLLSRVQRRTISGNANRLRIRAIDETSRVAGSRLGGIRAYRDGEGDTLTATQPSFRRIDLELKKLTGLYYATDELLQDTVALEQEVRSWFEEEFGFKVDDEIINGNGAAQMLGILQAGCLVSVSAETGQDATTIVAENIFNMWSRMWAGSRPNSVWLINQDIEPQLFTMSLSVGTGGAPVYLPANGIAGNPFGTLMGRPVLPIEQCASLGTVGDIILADLSEYVMAEKGGLRADTSIHVRFLNDETAFRFVMRNDGAPRWSSALTPANGTNTLSPFVALATRS